MDSTQTVTTDALLGQGGLVAELPFYFPGTANFEMVWKMGFDAMAGRGGEFTVPLDVMEYIDEDGMAELENRVSSVINAPVIAFCDSEHFVWRVMRKPELQNGAALAVDKPKAGEVSNEQTAAVKKPTASQQKAGKKVPRPPNCWMLYLQYWHAKVKEELGPKFSHATDISPVIAKKWRAEGKAGQAPWRAEAQRIRHEFYLQNPGYVYAPRRPGEKKRRTPRKAQAKSLSTSTATESVADIHDSGPDSTIVQDADPTDQSQFSTAPTQGPTFNNNFMMNSLANFDMFPSDLDLLEVNEQEASMDTYMSPEEIEAMEAYFQQVQLKYY